ncbi:chromate efflux transporter [Undibacterium baiyunense]|uniref:Chromate efflux transporter n=1 Tax=Undibacterium baiyunense TaxID=2828731 RepID=A0A941I328_9BURK|nr:chromate efflux transporter [Undibacterium baiyunense]MBR7745986.1 chromate efflux transporter [Undibacterium baiyunense]
MPPTSIDFPKQSPPPVPSFSSAFRFWLKLGLISFGGPAGQIAIMHQELVEKRRWISEQRFLHALNYCMLLPGPEAQQLAIYIGWLLHGIRGGIVAGVLFVLPSLLMLIGLSWLYIAYGQTSLIAGLFYGIKPAVTAIVLQAAYGIGGRTLQNISLWTIAIAAFIALFIFHLPFPLIILCAALIGYLGGRYLPQHFQARGGHASKSTTTTYGAAVIDDNTPTPEHARFRWTSVGRVLLVGILLWSLPMLSLIYLFGWQHSLTQMAWYFTKAALMTFGGAYAVLPYVMQAAVVDYGWLSAGQMIDGLALGETTPGPLIMVLIFVGFVAAYMQALFGPEQLFFAGTVAAIIVTWFTFLPSFILILAGGPFIESTHHQFNLTASLSAITAAVVGVIVNLTLFFAYHVLWPQGFNAAFDVWAAGIALFSALALIRFKWNVIWVIVLAASAGLLIQLSLT